MSKDNNKKTSFKDFLKKKDDFDCKIKKASFKKRKKLLKDSDNDSLSDYEEVNIYGTDPNNPDTDKDGMSDGEEVKKGRNPLGKGYLKDLFIPHEGNDYHPYSLHPKRILFYSASAVIVKIVVVCFVLIYPLSAWMTPDIAKEESQKIIQLTNKLRSDSSLPVLKENQKLNQAAYEKIQDMFLEQYFAHTSPKNLGLEYWLGQVGYDYASAGENLAMGFNSPEEVMVAWKKSPTHYNNLVDSCFKEIGVSFVGDIFNKHETVFVAQYFGAPKYSLSEANIAPEIISEPAIKTGAKTVADNSILATSPIVDREKTKVTIDEPIGKKEKVVKISAVLSPDTKEAVATVLDKKISLNQTEDGDWQGQAIVQDDSMASEESWPVVPASLAVTDITGQIAQTDINLENIQPQKTSFMKQYLLLKNNPNQAIEKIFDISSLYFKIILLLTLILLSLMIFIEIKIQRKRAIAHTVGLVLLLILFIAI